MEVQRSALLGAAGGWVTAAAAGNLPDVLAEDLVELLELPEISVIEFRRDAAPALLNRFDYEGGDPKLHVYLSKTYALDPFYNTFLRGDRWGFMTLEEVLPDWKELREPWADYLELANMLDECGYLVEVADGVAINVAFVRRTGARFFGDRTTGLLRDLEPLINSVVRLYWSLHNRESGLAKRQAGFEKINSVLSAFGSSVLTPREQEMVQLLLKGYSAKLVAEAMEISLGTVNVHRANIYSKLDINSYKELFSLFINAVSSVEVEPGEDIYEAYCRPPAN